MMVECRMMDVREERCNANATGTRRPQLDHEILLRSQVRTYKVQWAMGQHKLELTANQNF